MFRFLTVLLAVSVCFCFGQKSPIKFGDIPMEDMKMTLYSKDSSAAAVVLADYGESSIVYLKERGFTLSFERITRIKILKKDGFKWGDFEILLYHDSQGNSEKLQGLKAVTYNLEEGKIVETKIKNESIAKTKYDENFELTKIALTKIKEGSIVEITYSISSDFITHFQDWEFQYTIPVRLSEYRARIPEYFYYEKFIQGYVALDVNETTTDVGTIVLNSFERGGMNQISRGSTDAINYKEQKHRWAALDVPAFKEEPYITTTDDYISKINFELSQVEFPNEPVKNYMGSWEEINERYVESENFGGALKGNVFLKDKTAALVSPATSPEERVSILYQYVRDNFLWDGSTRKFINTPLRKVFDERKGSSAELNLILASMLQKADVEVYPVLVSTRDNGFIREQFPNSTQFNHTICVAKVGDKELLLDATQKFLPTGLLPERCLNSKGLVISKNGHRWVDLNASIKSRTSISGELTLTDEGNFTGKISIDRTGYTAEKVRKKYFSKGETEYVKEFLNNNSWEIKKSTFENTKQLSAPIKEVHDLTIKDYAIISGDRIYFNPFFIERKEENQFKSATREYPVSFESPFDHVNFYRITIPPQYEIEEIPTSKAMALPNNGGKFLFNVTKANNRITITSSMQINRQLFSQDEYPALRELYTQIVAKQAEQIVLKKK